MHDHPHEQCANAKQEQHIIIVGMHERLIGIAALEIDQAANQRQICEGHAQAVGPACHPEEFIGQRPQHLRQCQRQDTEENTRVAHADVAERSRYQAGEHESDHNVDFDRADAEIPDQEGSGVGADAEIGRMAERKQSRVAEQQIEPESRDRIDQPVGE